MKLVKEMKLKNIKNIIEIKNGRAVVCLSALVITLTGFMLYEIFQGKSDEQALLAEKIKSYEERNEFLRQCEVQLKDADAAEKQTKKERESLGGFFIAASDADNIFAKLAAIGEAENVSIERLEPVGALEMPDKNISLAKYELTVGGDFFAVLSFIKTAEEKPPFTVIEKLQLEEKDDVLKANMEIAFLLKK
jgi:hypothetical protein